MMSVSKGDTLAAIQGMSARFASLEATVAGQGRQLGDLVCALKTMQGSQAFAAEWQTQVSSHMSATDKVIDELKQAVKKESPRHKLPHKGAHGPPRHRS